MSRRSEADARKSLREFPKREPRSPGDTVSFVNADEKERKRIGRDLHDEVGQGLMSLRFSLGMLVKDAAEGPLKKRAKATLEILDITIDGLRRVLGRLSPKPLEDLGLLGAIQREADLVAKRTGMIPHVSLPNDLTLVDREVEIGVYRAIQEALHNVSKHSGARNFTVTLQDSANGLSLQVVDDGSGFASKAAASVESFGLAGMRERVKALGGTLRIHSIRNGGTRIQIEIPLKSAALSNVQTLVPNVGARAS